MADEITSILSNPAFFKLLIISISLNIFFTVVGGILNIINRVQEFFIRKEIKQYDTILYKRFKAQKTKWWKRLFK